MDRFDEYQKAALIGLLSGVPFPIESDSTTEVTDDDLMQLKMLCIRIANVMIKD